MEVVIAPNTRTTTSNPTAELPSVEEVLKKLAAARALVALEHPSLDPDDVLPVTNGKVEEYREKVVTFKDGKLGMAGWSNTTKQTSMECKSTSTKSQNDSQMLD